MDLRSDLLAVNDCKCEKLDIPEWGHVGTTQLYARGLTLDERTAIANEANSANGASDATKNNILTRRLVLYGVCNADGVRVFADEDFELLGRKNANVLDRIGLKVSALSKLGADDVKELEKNSEATPTGSSASS